MKKIVYMEWVKTRPRARYELGGSAVPPVMMKELPEARRNIEINASNLYGYRPLLEQIARQYQIAPTQVVTTQGTSMANYLACAAVLERGDEVLVEKPAYEPLLGVPRLLGAKVKRFPRRFRDSFRIDIDELARRISRRTRLVVLTNMHNPSGVLASERELRAVARLARGVGAHVLIDEVYLDLAEEPARSAVHLAPNMIVTSSLTKAYGFDGLRCGWVLCAPKLAKAIWRLQDFFGVNGAVPAEQISTTAFQKLDRFRRRSISILRANRPLVDAFLDSHHDSLDCVPSDGAPVCFPRLTNGESGTSFARRLRSRYDTVVIPGDFFEMPRHFRLGFGCNTETLRGGLRQISRALRE